MKKQTPALRPRFSAKANATSAARLCAKTFLFAAAATGIAFAPEALWADKTVGPRVVAFYNGDYPEDFDASSGTITVLQLGTALVHSGDISSNNFIITGRGAYGYVANPDGADGALRINNNAMITGSVTVVGESSISTQITGRAGSIGTISGAISGTDRVTVGFWNLRLDQYISASEMLTVVGMPSDPRFGPHPRDPNSLSEEFSHAKSTLILLGNNDAFTGSMRVAPFTTLQIGDGSGGLSAGLGGTLANADILLTTDRYYDTLSVNAGRRYVSAAKLVINKDASAGVTVLNGSISGHGEVVKRGGGTLVLAGNNSEHYGDFVVERGTLSFSNLLSLGLPSQHLPGGGGGVGIAKTIHLHPGSTVSYTGTEADVDLGERFTLALEGSGTATLNIAAAQTVVKLWKITGAEGRQLAKSGNGSLTLAGNESNTGAGLSVSGGLVELDKDGTATAIGAGGLTVSGGIVRITGTSVSQMADNAPVVLNSTAASAGVFDLNGHNVSFGSLATASSSSGNLPQVVNHGDASTLSIGSADTNTTFAGLITGGISLVKAGAGTLVLSADSSYTGTTEVRGGVLQIGAGGTTGRAGAASSAIQVFAGATFAINRSDSFTYSRIITGAGNFTKEGAGTLTLSSAADYTGVTTVKSGKLVFAGDYSGSFGGLRIDSQAAVQLPTPASFINLSGTAYESHAGSTGTLPLGAFDIGGSLRLNGSHRLSVGGSEEVATLKISGTLALNSGTLAITIAEGASSGNSSRADSVEVTNLESSAAPSGFNIAPVFTDGVRGGTYDIVSWSGTGLAPADAAKFAILHSGPGGTELPTPRGYTNYEISVVAKKLVLTVTGTGNHVLTWMSGPVSTWNASTGADDPAEGNWIDNTQDSGGNVISPFFNYDIVRFDDESVISDLFSSVHVSAPVTPSRISVKTEGQGFYFRSTIGVGKITGGTGIVKTGRANLGLSGGNDFTGTVEVQAGQLIVVPSGLPSSPTPAMGDYGEDSAIGAGGDASAILIHSGGKLTFSRSLPNDLPLAEGVYATTYTKRSFTLGTSAGGSYAVAGGSIVAGQTDGDAMTTPTLVVLGAVAGDGTPDALAFQGTGNRTLTLSGITGAFAGTNQTFGGRNATGAAVFNLRLTDPEGGALAVTKEGTGAWFLGNTTNTYTGGTRVTGGILGVSSVSALGAVPKSLSTSPHFLSLDGATFVNYGYTGNGRIADGTSVVPSGDFTAGSLVFGETQGVNIGSNHATIEIAESTSITFRAPVSGVGRIDKTGDGEMRLAANNTFTGGLTAMSGAVILETDNALPATGLGIHLAGPATLDLNGRSVSINHFRNRNTTLGKVTYDDAKQGISTGTIQNLVPNTNVTLTFGEGPESQLTSFSGTILQLPPIPELDDSDNPLFDPVTGNQVFAHPSSISVVKAGAGILNLSLGADSNFSGTLTVKSGVLRLGLAQEIPKAVGDASSIIVYKGGVLDLFGNQIADRRDEDTDILTVAPTIYIEGNGRYLVAGNFGSEPTAFIGDSGALTASFTEPEGLQPGETAPPPRGSRADHIVLLGSSLITTFVNFSIGDVRGKGDLTLGALTAEAAELAATSKPVFTIVSHPLSEGTENFGIRLLPMSGGFLQDNGTGALYLRGVGLDVTADKVAIETPGGMHVTGAKSFVRLDAVATAGNFAGIIDPTIPVSFANGATLTLVGSGLQRFTYLRGADATVHLTRENRGSATSTAVVYLDTPDVRDVAQRPDVVPQGTFDIEYFRWRGKIGSVLEMTREGNNTVYAPAAGTNRITLVKRGVGEYYLGGGDPASALGGSDYNGQTIIESGTLVLEAPLTVQLDPIVAENGDTTTYAPSGVLGVPDDNSAENLILYGGSTLRDISGVLSSTKRLFTIRNSGVVTIESSTGRYNSVGAPSSLVGNPGLRFTNTGPVAFSRAGSFGAEGVTFVLGGDKTPTATSSKNLFSLGLNDPPSGKTSLHKEGTGEWLIGGNNNYTGSTHIKAGRLVLNSPGAIPAASAVILGSSSFTASSVATLALNGNSVMFESLRVDPAVPAAFREQAAVINGDIAHKAVLELCVPKDVERTFSGSLGDADTLLPAANTFSFVKSGKGVQVLSGIAEYTGITEVREGILRIEGNTISTLKSPMIFVDSGEMLAPDAEEQEDAPRLDVLALTPRGGFLIQPDTTLVAGTSARVSYDLDQNGWQVKRDLYTADLVGSFVLNGGTLHVGGIKEVIPAEADGAEASVRIGDRVGILVIAGSLARPDDLGELRSLPDTTSSIYFTFGEKARIPGQNALFETREEAIARLPVSDLIRLEAVTFEGVVEVYPGYEGATGFRLDAGTIDTPAAYPFIEWKVAPSRTTVENIRYATEDPRYIITFSNSISAQTIYMNVVATTSDLPLYWRGDPANQWGDPSSTGTNFFQPGVGKASFAPGNHAVFNDEVTVAARRQIFISEAGVELGAATFDSKFDYTILEGSGKMTDTFNPDTNERIARGYLEKLGTGTLFLNNVNEYTGGTILGAGRIVVNNDRALSTGDIYFQGGTLTATVPLTFPNRFHIQGEATFDAAYDMVIPESLDDGLAAGVTPPVGGSTNVLVKTGASTLILAGDASKFTGTVQVKEGTVVLGGAANAARAAFVLEAGSTLSPGFETNAENNGEVPLGSLSGSGTFRNNTTGAKKLIVGARDISPETAPAVFQGTVNEGAGDAGGAVTLVKVGAGTLVLANQINAGYTGGTIVKSGTLQVGWNNKNASIGAGPITLENDGAGALGTLVFDGDRTLSQDLFNTLQGGGELIKRNTNALHILGDNAAFHGTIHVAAGELHLGNNSNIGNFGAADIINDGILVFNRGTADYPITNKISGGGELRKMDSGTLVFTGENTSTGATIIYSGTFQIGDGTYNQQLNYISSDIYLGGSTLDLNIGEGGILALGANLSGAAGTVRKHGSGTAIFTGNSTLAGLVQIQEGRFQVGDGGEHGAIPGNTQVFINSGAEFRVNRSGPVEFNGRITSEGRIVVQNGTAILTDDNEIAGDVSIQSGATLQIGNGGVAGSFNSTGRAVTVQIAGNARLVYDINGTGATTGESLLFQGGGNFIKRGPGTLTFNSTANHSGGTIVEQGRLILDTRKIPLALIDPAYNPNHTAYLAAEGAGALELRNGATPFALEAYLRGTGTITLAADATISEGTRTTFNFLPVSTPATLAALEIAQRATLNLGTDSYARLSTGTLRILEGGLLTGQATLAGNLTVQRGGEIRPGTGNNQITIEGDLTTAGHFTLAFKSDEFGRFYHDSIHYRGTATFESGASLYVDIANLGSDFPDTLTEYQLIADDEPWNPAGNNNTTGGVIQTNPALAQYGITYNNGKGIALLASKTGAGIWDIPGLRTRLPSRLKGYTNYLDTIARNPTGNQTAWQIVSGILNAGDPAATIAAAAPDGHAALAAMSTTSAHRASASTRAHLESLRYDRVINARLVHRSELTGQPEAGNDYVNTNATGLLTYIAGDTTLTRNTHGADAPAFNHNLYTGTAGLDWLATQNFALGIAATYNRGHATLHHGTGKVDTDNFRASIYASILANDWVFFDLQAFGGHTTGKTTRNTTHGQATAKPTAHDYGASAYVGTAITLPFTNPTLKDRFHLTPYAGFEYVHTEAGTFNETGAGIPYRITQLTQDSLHLRLGTGANWVAHLTRNTTARFTLNAAFTAELADDSARISAQFLADTTNNRFRYTAPATPAHTFQVGPSVEFTIGNRNTLTLGYLYETDFNTHTTHSLSASYRFRF